MATYLSPGVYVEEVATGPKPIAGVPTSVAAIVGRTEKGPRLDPRRLTGWNDYLEVFGSPIEGSYTAESAFGFFENGGTALWIVRADNSSLSQWEVRDAGNNLSFPIDAHSPGGWSAGMDVRVGQETGGGKGQLFSSRVTRTTTFSLAAATPLALPVDSTVGAIAGTPVTVADAAGNTANGTIDSVGAGTVTVTPAGAATFPADSDIRIYATVPNAAPLLTLAVGSGFQPGDIVRARPATGSVQTAVVQRVQNVGAGAVLTLSSPISGSVSGMSFGQKVVGLPITITTVTTASGKSNVAPSGITFRGADPGFANADYVRLVTAEGLEAAFTGGAGTPPNVFQFPITLAQPPDRGVLYAKVSVSPWQDGTGVVIPTGASAADVTSILEGLYSYLPAGSKLQLTKTAGGSQNFTRSGTGTWTTQGGIGNAPGEYNRAQQIVDPADGFDARVGLLVQSPVAPEVGDYVTVGGLPGPVRILEVLQEPGMAANVYKLRFASNFSAAATGAKWALSAWQPTVFESLRFSITATNAQPGRPVVSEVYSGLSLNPLHPRYYFADAIINDRSRLIQVGSLPAAISPTAPASLPMSVSQSRAGSAGTLDVAGFSAAFDTLERETEPALLAAPDALTLGADMLRSAVLNDMIGHCEDHRRFAVVDLPNESDDQGLLEWRLLHLDSTYAAGYAPFLTIINMRPEGVATTVDVPPSGFVMGVYARTDNDRGVWKAPANERVKGLDHLMVPYTQRRQDLLNPKGVNLLRSFPGRGMRIWGARNLTDDTQWRYVNVRRLFLFLENSIDGGTQWVVFEPNDATTWLRVRVSVENFLNQVWRAGGLAGGTPEQAYRVRVGLGQTMTETDIELGLLIIEVAVAPVYPAEFVVFRISHKRLTE